MNSVCLILHVDESSWTSASWSLKISSKYNKLANIPYTFATLILTHYCISKPMFFNYPNFLTMYVYKYSICLYFCYIVQHWLVSYFIWHTPLTLYIFCGGYSDWKSDKTKKELGFLKWWSFTLKITRKQKRMKIVWISYRSRLK